LCASVCPSDALWYGTPEEFAATRKGTLVNEWQFGRQHVTTKVHTVADAPGPVDVAGADGGARWQDDPFGLAELGGGT
ncbi:MAG: 4Fe-4S dicluster domain-containing protein, partial [Acidimicrobiales bacterium]